MKKITNKDIFDFISSELNYHPELSQHSREELKAKCDDESFWLELQEHLDCFRICDICGRPIVEGYVVDDGREIYCSESCLLKNYKKEQIKEIFQDANGIGTSYYTNWYEESISYNK